jgi:chromosome condensin MukBEF ATPase and DNA-binding subunit MukB
MATRLAEIRSLVDKVDQFRQSMDVAAESARQIQDIKLQIDRAERVAGLLGKTFVNSRRKFDELDEMVAKQQETAAKVTDLAFRLAELEARVEGTPASPQVPLQTQPATSHAIVRTLEQQTIAPTANQEATPTTGLQAAGQVTESATSQQAAVSMFSRDATQPTGQQASAPATNQQVTPSTGQQAEPTASQGQQEQQQAG